MITIVGDPQDWGYIPNFLDELDPRSAREQFNEKYLGGWHPMKHPGLTFDPKTQVMRFPGDPPFEPRSRLLFRHEILLLYPGSFVLVLQPDDTWEAARMD